MSKKLLLIPIIHSEKEMGSLRSDISEIIDEKFGKEKRDEHRKEVALFWENLRALITVILSCVHGRSIKIYQDGIPIGGDIGVKLVRMGAEDGIPNHQIVLSIIEQGGILEKTENPELLKEEYDILKSIITAKTGQERELQSEKHKRRLYDLTIERDRFIAHRIAESLKDEELGFLFIGATHNVTPYLPSDIDLFICNFVEEDITAWLAGEGPDNDSLSGGEGK
jgi:hypothetical protein